MNNILESSFEQFKDIVELMLSLDFDIFRISFILYRNFDFTDYKESYVKLTKKLYKDFSSKIETVKNLPVEQLKSKKSYKPNLLWDEININTSAPWIIEFATFLRLDKDQYYLFISKMTNVKRPVQSY